jgi:hypothetical protein
MSLLRSWPRFFAMSYKDAAPTELARFLHRLLKRFRSYGAVPFHCVLCDLQAGDPIFSFPDICVNLRPARVDFGLRFVVSIRVDSRSP